MRQAQELLHKVLCQVSKPASLECTPYGGPMKSLAVIASTLCLALGFAFMLSPSQAEAELHSERAIFYPTDTSDFGVHGKPCVRTEFKTELIEQACEEGGQVAAKKAMKSFLRKAKKQDSSINCQSCHTRLKPDYELAPDALERFKELGGK